MPAHYNVPACCEARHRAQGAQEGRWIMAKQQQMGQVVVAYEQALGRKADVLFSGTAEQCREHFHMLEVQNGSDKMTLPHGSWVKLKVPKLGKDEKAGFRVVQRQERLKDAFFSAVDRLADMQVWETEVRQKMAEAVIQEGPVSAYFRYFDKAIKGEVFASMIRTHVGLEYFKAVMANPVVEDTQWWEQQIADLMQQLDSLMDMCRDMLMSASLAVQYSTSQVHNEADRWRLKSVAELHEDAQKMRRRLMMAVG